jgi:hypothetical protein
VICLHRLAANHGGKWPVLAFWDGRTAVFVDKDQLLRSGHRHNGVLLTEPIAFTDITAIAAVAVQMLGTCEAVEHDETRDGGGKLTTLTVRPGGIRQNLTPKA